MEGLTSHSACLRNMQHQARELTSDSLSLADHLDRWSSSATRILIFFFISMTAFRPSPGPGRSGEVAVTDAPRPPGRPPGYSRPS